MDCLSRRVLHSQGETKDKSHGEPAGSSWTLGHVDEDAPKRNVGLSLSRPLDAT
jgi:hypothetical protein